MENCNEMIRSFFQKLAATLMKNDKGVMGFNITADFAEGPCLCEPVIDCDNNHIHPERVVTQGFGKDFCEKNAIKLTGCAEMFEGPVFDDPLPPRSLYTEDGDEGTKVLWECDETFYDNFEIWYNGDPLDPYDYSLVDTVPAGTFEWEDDDFKNGDYQIRTARGSQRSEFSDPKGVMVFDLTSTGDGSGVADIRLSNFSLFNSPIILTGDGRFYSDKEGTLGEGTRRELDDMIPTNLFYVKVASNDNPTRLVVFNKQNISAMGHGEFPGWSLEDDGPSLYIHMGHLGLSLVHIYIEGANTISGFVDQIPGVNVQFTCLGSNIIAGSLEYMSNPNLVKLVVDGENFIREDIADVPATVTHLELKGDNRIDTYTSRAWADMDTFVLNPADTYGLSVAEVSQLVIDLSDSTWEGDKVLTLGGANASMADTVQGGIWGDFADIDVPSDLAVALKSLVAQGVTVTLNDIELPGGEGDGVGFPASFGVWWRS